jgi:hypothetical protein
MGGLIEYTLIVIDDDGLGEIATKTGQILREYLVLLRITAITTVQWKR